MIRRSSRRRRRVLVDSGSEEEEREGGGKGEEPVQPVQPVQPDRPGDERSTVEGESHSQPGIPPCVHVLAPSPGFLGSFGDQMTIVSTLRNDDGIKSTRPTTA